MAITNFQQLDPNKIKKAYDKGYTQEDVQNTLRKKGILPKEDISDKTFSGTNGTTGVSNIGGTPTSDFQKAQGYKEGQVGMEGINLYKGVTPKSDIKTQPSEGTSGGFSEEEKKIGGEIGDIIKGGTTGKTDTTQGVTPKTETDTTTTTTPSTEIDVTDMNALDDKITDLQKKVAEGQLNADELAETERQIRYYESIKRDQEYLQKQRDTQKEYDEITGEIKDIQSSQRLRQASDSLQAMKQNIAYLGNMGRPGQSSVKLDAIDKQIQEGNKVYSELVRIEELYKRADALGETSKAAEFERQMDDLQRDLDDNVNKTLQDALGKIDKAEMDGILRSPEDMEKFKEILFQNVDMTVAEISDRQWRKMNDLLTIYQDDVNRKKEFETNKNKIGEQSEVLGYYVDGNGTPLINAETGQRIKTPQQLPQDYQSFTMGNEFFATRLDANGNVMYDENGMPIFSKTSLVDNVTFEEQTMQNYATMFARGQIGISDLQNMGLSQGQIASIVSQSAGVSTVGEAPDVVRIGTDKKGNPIYGTYNQSTGQYEPISMEDAAAMQEGIDYSTLDFSTNQDLINKYPNEAAFKNNNPTGMTWGISDNLKNLFNEAGIQYSMGSQRPANEGGNYIKFASVEDGLLAYQIALTQAGSDNVYNRLATWVGTTDTAKNDKYAKDLMAIAGIPQGAKFSELNATQLGLLMDAQLQRESPNFYNELGNIEQTSQVETQGFDEASVPDFQNYFKTGKITAADQERFIEEFGSIEEFKRQANEYGKSNLTAQYDFAVGVKELAEALKDEEGRYHRMTSGFVQYTPFFGGNEADLQANLNALKSKLSLQNLMDLKAGGATFGSLSNQELNFITNASTALNTKITDERWKEELDRIIGKMDAIIEKSGIEIDRSGDIQSEYQQYLPK